MKLCVVTCTGGRSELFALCNKWVRKQTVQPDLWIVATDNGDVPANLPEWGRHLSIPQRPDSFSPNRTSTSATWSLHWTLGKVPADHAVVVMEDDDWYAPHHAETCLRQLKVGHMVTFGDTVVRFHVPERRWSGLSLGAEDAIEGTVGLHPDGIARYRESLMTPCNWSPMEGKYEGYTTVGIKGVGFGLPGRTGATTKHKPRHYKTIRMQRDPGFHNFRRLLGADAEDYIALLR